MRSALRYLVVGLLCLGLLIPCACTSGQSDVQTPPTQSPSSPAPDIPSPTPDQSDAPTQPSEPAPMSEPNPQPTPSVEDPSLHPDEETELTYTLDGEMVTVPAVLHHSQHGYSIICDAAHYECSSQFEVDSYWSDVGLYLSVSLVYNMPLDYVLDGLQLQENIEMGAQPTYIGSGLYPAYTLYHTTEDGMYRQFWALEYGADTMLIERSYPVEHESADLHHAVQDAMLSTLTFQNSPVSATKGMSTTYASVLEDLLYRYKLPDVAGEVYDGSFGDISENRFAVYDIDNDGSMELIIEYTTTITAGMSLMVFGYDEESDCLHTQLWEFPNAQFFNNGTIEAGASHNHSYSGVFWPYTLYQYSSSSDVYVSVGMVSAWDKMVLEEDFPDHIDEDGDGLVYYIIDEGFDSEVPVDGAEYFAWRSFYMGAAEPIALPYLPLTAENIASLK